MNEVYPTPSTQIAGPINRQRPQTECTLSKYLAKAWSQVDYLELTLACASPDVRLIVYITPACSQLEYDTFDWFPYAKTSERSSEIHP